MRITIVVACAVLLLGTSCTDASSGEERAPSPTAAPTTMPPQPTTTLPATTTTVLTSGLEVGGDPTEAFETFTFATEIGIGDEDNELSIASTGRFADPDFHCDLSLGLGGIDLDQSVTYLDNVVYYDNGFADLQTTTIDDPTVTDAMDLCPGTSAFWSEFGNFGAVEDLSGFEGASVTTAGRPATEYDLTVIGERGSAIEDFPFESVEAFRLTVDNATAVLLAVEMIGVAGDAAIAAGVPVQPGGTFIVRFELADVNQPMTIEAPVSS